MNRMGAKLMIVLAAAFVIAGCSKKKGDCPFLAPDIVYTGFSEAETDTFVIRRFQKNSGFAKPLDTFEVTRAHIVRTPVGKDSVTLVPDNYPRLTANFFVDDWQIYFPSINRTVQITNAIPEFTQEKEVSSLCHSYVSSVNVDGTVFRFNSWFDTPYRIYVLR